MLIYDPDFIYTKAKFQNESLEAIFSIIFFEYEHFIAIK